MAKSKKSARKAPKKSKKTARKAAAKAPAKKATRKAAPKRAAAKAPAKKATSKKPRKPMSEETKAMLRARRAAPKRAGGDRDEDMDRIVNGLVSDVATLGRRVDYIDGEVTAVKGRVNRLTSVSEFILDNLPTSRAPAAPAPAAGGRSNWLNAPTLPSYQA